MKKRVLGIIAICVAIVLGVEIFMLYAGFILAYRTEIIVLCTIGTASIMGYRCACTRKETAKRIDALLNNINSDSGISCAPSQSREIKGDL